MTGSNDNVKAHRMVTFFFAFVAGVSAVSTAVAPAILH